MYHQYSIIFTGDTRKVYRFPGLWTKYHKCVHILSLCITNVSTCFLQFERSEEEKLILLPDPARRYTLYRNPTTDIFTLLNKGEIITGEVQVEIFDMQGNRILSSSYESERSRAFVLDDKSPGLYFIKVINGDRVESFKLIVTR